MSNSTKNVSVPGVVEQNFPLVSVIIPVFNGVRFLARSLASIQVQIYPNIEIVAVDDGSFDGSFDLLKSFFDSWQGQGKILAHPRRQNLGIAETYILGLENSHGKYVTFLEQDDFWTNNKISEQIKAFNSFPDVGVVFSDVYICDEAGKVTTKAFKTIINQPPSLRPFNAFNRLLWGNCLFTFSNIMIRREQLNMPDDIITEPEGFQDWMLLLKLSSRCKFYHCNRTQTFWRHTENSYFGKLKQLPNYMLNYRKQRKLALRKAIDALLLEKTFFFSKIRARFYWYPLISLLSAAERLADFMNRKGISKGRNPYKSDYFMWNNVNRKNDHFNCILKD